jgi:hypothetical protein
MLYFKMGEINFGDSREQLEYTDKTFTALSSRITEIFTKIQDSIQEKFVSLPTIWDAKIMYNAIFGTGIIEVEKNENADVTEKIKILDGNLAKLEQTFENTFTWKGIVLNGPSFTDINRFDNSDTDHIWDDSHEPVAPVMISYRKKKSRVKAHRCTEEKSNKIVASAKVAVVLNDTGRKTGQQMVARYLILTKEYFTVHVLNFGTDQLKDRFYKEYNFASVPVIKLSEVLPEAKTWNNTNKVTRNYGGGGNGVRPMKYLDLESGEVEKSEVPVQEIEDGGYYVTAAYYGWGRHHHRSERINGREHSIFAAIDVINDIKIVCDELDIDIDRIYIITEKIATAKWFKEATASGDWIPLWKTIEDSLPNLSMSVDSLVDAGAYESTTTISEETAKKLAPLIIEKNSPILKLISTVSGCDYDAHIKVKNAFSTIGMWKLLLGDHKGTIDFNSAEFAVRSSYPYLPWESLKYDSDDVSVKKIADYINAMDLYVDLTRDTTPKPVEVQTELIAA